jgi:glycosyltransferase involved in cell wall biosynthesis
MKKRILVRGPALSRSGYGEQTRFALRALRNRKDVFDIFLINIPWGHTGFVVKDDEERKWLDYLLLKTIQHIEAKQPFDMSLQVTIPNEWEKIAPINIGYTAGIETTKVAPIWLAKGNEMDKIIVVSEHSKNVYETTTYTAKNEDTGEVIENYQCQTPIEAVNYPVRYFEPEAIEGVKFDYDFNFLLMAQWGIRKNIDNTIKWFVEEFKDSEVGLVVKTSIAKDCTIDREITTTRLEELLKPYKERKCKIYLLHGTLSEEEMTWLYRHNKIKAMVSLSHGEGFGLPLFEAAYNGLPIITSLWSGQADFLYAPNKNGKARPMVAKVGYTLAPVYPEAHWEGVIEKDAMWAYPAEKDYKAKLREVYKNHTQFKGMAKKLKKHIEKNFQAEVLYKEFTSAVCSDDELEWLDTLGDIEIL